MTEGLKFQEFYFYYKNKEGQIEPSKNKEYNKEAKIILRRIYCELKGDLPEKFVNNWDKARLYDPNGSIKNAHAVILDPKEGAYDLRNKLNHLTGKEWTKFLTSYFIFNARKEDLIEEKKICENTEDHPATYSPTLIGEFIKFFTKERMKVLDPFAGIGSTLVGCKRTGRIGYGIELNKKYYDIILKRVPEFSENVFNEDARNVKQIFNGTKFDFSISSPPYWNILHRSTGSFKEIRKRKSLDVQYSMSKIDLGNIPDYNLFLTSLTNIYFDIFDLLHDKAYIVIIVKNVKKGGKLYPLAWDLARILSTKYSLKDEKIWIQNEKNLAPYGYPYAWVSNILHHYCLVLRKEKDG